jgi:hypothetical protein
MSPAGGIRSSASILGVVADLHKNSSEILWFVAGPATVPLVVGECDKQAGENNE